VAPSHDLLYEPAVIGHRHSEQEEGRLRVELVEQVEQQSRLPLERRVRLVPVG
jgi:hypothetical protein